MCQKKTISNGEVWVKGEKYLPVGSFAQYNRMFLHFVIKSVLDRPELLMDVVKLKGRAQKVQVGDCVSVSGGYFGKPFQKTLYDIGFVDGRAYGRVVEVLEETNQFTVKWDLDEQVTYDHKLFLCLSHSSILSSSLYPSIHLSIHLHIYLSISPSASFAFFLHLLTAFFRIFRLFFSFFFLLIQPLFEFFDADVGPVGHLMSSNTICLAGVSGLLE